MEAYEQLIQTSWTSLWIIYIFENYLNITLFNNQWKLICRIRHVFINWCEIWSNAVVFYGLSLIFETHPVISYRIGLKYKVDSHFHELAWDLESMQSFFMNWGDIWSKRNHFYVFEIWNKCRHLYVSEWI